MNRKEDTGGLLGAIARLAKISEELGVPVPLDLKSRHRKPPQHCCPNCGGDWIGDGFSVPLHCERIECPGDREPDADPLPCELPESDCGPCPACAGSLNGTMRYDEYRDAVRCDACGYYQAE